MNIIKLEKTIWFCEGIEDKVCYLPKLKNILIRDLRIYVVGGKDNVLEVYKRCPRNQRMI